MKLVTKIAKIATLASFMFAGVNLTWGNTFVNNKYAIDDNGTPDNDADDFEVTTSGMQSAGSWGVHFDVSDYRTFGWEGGLMVGLAGPAGSTFRLGYGDSPSLGMSYTWWEGSGTGWGTNLSTALDYELTDKNDFSITVNLGLGF